MSIKDKIIDVDDIKQEKGNVIWRQLIGEFMGNLLLNFFGVGSVVFTSSGDTVVYALAFGFVVFILVLTIGHVSGGHFNPAISFAMLVTGNIGIIKLVLYIIMQCLGAIAGTGLLKLMSPKGYRGNYGCTSISPSLTPLKGWGYEFLLGYILSFVVFGFCDPDRPESTPTGALAIGGSIIVGVAAFAEATGPSMNPARSLGSAVIGNYWENHWIYWAGPIPGAMVAALMYRWIFMQKTFGGEKTAEEG